MSVPFTLFASCFTVAWVAVIFEVTHCLSVSKNTFMSCFYPFVSQLVYFNSETYLFLWYVLFKHIPHADNYINPLNCQLVKWVVKFWNMQH
jgi:hypothetical protein